MSGQVAVSELQDWLRKSLSSNLSQAERDRDKLVSEISRAIDSLREFCAQLSGKAEQDMEAKRDNRVQFRAAKSVARLTDIISEMAGTLLIPAAKDSVSLRNLQRETSKRASDAARARDEWLRQIRPFYIIDMMTLGGNVDKIRRLGDELHTFLIGRGSLLRSFEDLGEKLESLTKLKGSRDFVFSQRQASEKKLREAEVSEISLRAKVTEIRQNPKMKEYLQTDAELKKLRTELLRTGFSRLGRPLRRLVSISERGNYPLASEVRENIGEYTRKPFTTFLKEDEGYPHLKAVMSTLAKAVADGKLALKPREAKKVIERSQEVTTEDSLTRIHSKSKELKREYDDFLADPERADLVQQLKAVHVQGRANRTLQEELKAELQRTLDNERRLDQQINLQLNAIEALARKLTGRNLKLQLA